MRRMLRSLRVAAATALLCTGALADTLNVTADTDINLGTPTQINGSVTSFFVRNTGAGGERHAFLRFNLTVLPANTAISRATLRLYPTAVNDPGPIDVRAVAGPWY